VGLAITSTYVYGGNPAARNAFRSTAAHNTLRVDGREIVPIPKDLLFALPGRVNSRIVHWHSDEAFDWLEAEHGGFKRLHTVGEFRRTFFFHKNPPFWILDDRLAGAGEHEMAWFFHLAPGAEVKTDDMNVSITIPGMGGSIRLAPIISTEIDAALAAEPAPISRAYGEREDSLMLRYTLRALLPLRIIYIVFPLDEITPAAIEPVELLRQYETIRADAE
jgi:hypothetical protein